MDIKRKEAFRWESYTYRHYNNQSVELFKDWIVFHPWNEVLCASGPDDKAAAYQKTVVEAVERYFPLKKRRKKTTDLPWMTKGIQKQIEDQKRLFVEEGGKRTSAWKEEKKRTNELLKLSRQGYMDTQKEHLLTEDENRNFFKHVRNFSRYERPEQFDDRNIVSGSDQEVAEKLAA